MFVMARRTRDLPSNYDKYVRDGTPDKGFAIRLRKASFAMARRAGNLPSGKEK
jgi:hypothetical protein